MDKIVLYTQRVEIIESYQERRDCVDQNIPRFLEECGYIPMPVPNVVQGMWGMMEVKSGNTKNVVGLDLELHFIRKCARLVYGKKNRRM